MKWTKWMFVLTVVLATALAGTTVAFVTRPREQGPDKLRSVPRADTQPRLLIPTDNKDELAKKLKTLRQQRLAAARTANATALAQYTAGRLLLIDVYFNSRQLLDAELAVSKNKADQLQAYQDHRDRMKKLLDLNQARFNVGRLSVEALSGSRCHFLEAEIWLTETQMPTRRGIGKNRGSKHPSLAD